MRQLPKVPVLVFALGLTLAACGGDAESADDLESERFDERVEAEVEQRVEERVEAEVEQRVEERVDAEVEQRVEERVEQRVEARDEERQESVVRERADAEREEAAREEAARSRDAAAGGSEAEAEVEEELVTIAAGTRIHTVVESDVSTRTHKEGSTFTVRVAEAVRAPDGRVIVPEGAELEGTVLEARSSTSSDEEALLVVGFERLLLDGGSVPLMATVLEADLETEAGDSGARSVAKVATGAAAGAVIGQIFGRDRRSTVAGAAAGAAAGAGVALTTRDGHAIIRQGSTMVVQVDQPVVLAAGG